MLRLSSFFVASCLLLPFFVQAATSDFTIKLVTGADVTPPSTPTLLSAIPVAPTQIDLSWSASSDNVQLSGYVLSRDGTAVATTTLTSFMDTGLTPETLYTYSVYAFDWQGNISTTSNQLATTTPEVPIVATSTPPVTTTRQPSATQVVILDTLDIIPHEQSAELRFSTNIPTRYTVRWGRTDAYTGGYVVNDAYQKNHETLITDLEPDTVYVYEITGTTPAGREIVLAEGNFRTRTLAQTVAVPNVERLQAIVEGNDVRLTWKIPPGVDLDSIRVVRSYLGYPVDRYDGAVVYNGKASSVLDEGSLSLGVTQYYTVFVVAADGMVSSGAVVAALSLSPEITEGSASGGQTGTSSGEQSLPSALPEITLFGLDPHSITLQQNGVVTNFLSERITLSPSEPFVVSIPFLALPDHLKAIIVTLKDPTDQRRSYSFLLKINPDRSAYQAMIAPLTITGGSRLTVEIYDFERALVGRYSAQIDFVAAPMADPTVLFPDAFIRPLAAAGPCLLAFGLIFLGWLFLFWRRSREAEDKR